MVAESEGTFSIDDWEELYDLGKGICCDEDGDENAMQDEGIDNGGEMMRFVKSVMEEKVQKRPPLERMIDDVEIFCYPTHDEFRVKSRGRLS